MLEHLIIEYIPTQNEFYKWINNSIGYAEQYFRVTTEDPENHRWYVDGELQYNTTTEVTAATLQFNTDRDYIVRVEIWKEGERRDFVQWIVHARRILITSVSGGDEIYNTGQLISLTATTNHPCYHDWYLDGVKRLSVYETQSTYSFKVPMAGEHKVLVVAHMGDSEDRHEFTIKVILQPPLIDSDNLMIRLPFDDPDNLGENEQDVTVEVNNVHAVVGWYMYAAQIEGNITIYKHLGGQYTVTYWKKDGDTFNFYAITSDGKKYVNAIEQDFTPIFTTTTGNVVINPSTVDEFRIYSTILSQDQILRMMDILRVKFYDEMNQEISVLPDKVELTNKTVLNQMHIDTITRTAILFHDDIPSGGTYFVIPYSLDYFSRIFYIPITYGQINKYNLYMLHTLEDYATIEFSLVDLSNYYSGKEVILHITTIDGKEVFGNSFDLDSTNTVFLKYNQKYKVTVITPQGTYDLGSVTAKAMTIELYVWSDGSINLKSPQPTPSPLADFARYRIYPLTDTLSPGTHQIKLVVDAKTDLKLIAMEIYNNTGAMIAKVNKTNVSKGTTTWLWTDVDIPEKTYIKVKVYIIPEGYQGELPDPATKMYVAPPVMGLWAGLRAANETINELTNNEDEAKSLKMIIAAFITATIAMGASMIGIIPSRGLAVIVAAIFTVIAAPLGIPTGIIVAVWIVAVVGMVALRYL
ncbi:MAG: hypothetical protein DRG33_06110 [Deltaproteobacteria bacterium]|nr:MAG: hypothetical protein DRG33_06110 [Deltaproteobacteria bacterium]